MAYHDIVYLFIFLPCSLAAYQLTPRRWRWGTLLLCSYIFFYSISGKLLFFLIGTSLITYAAGISLGAIKQLRVKALKYAEKNIKAEIRKKYKILGRSVLIAGVICLLSTLGYLKYYNFFAENFNILMQKTGGDMFFEPKALILPIGISFYTLQAVGYMADVYWEKIEPEYHLGKLSLFLGFFPQIMEGPIARYSDTASDLERCAPLQGENLSQGAVRIVWGLFKKMVIADRLAIPVNTIFDNYQSYSGVMIIVAAVAYTIQLYMEFSGCMDIVIGSGKMFGVKLPENFRQPFVSKNASEFWRRWHITLGVWLKTYVFYPVSVSSMVKKWNKFSRKNIGKHTAKVGTFALTLFPVWLCNGIWHGARWSYIFYGMYYFIILLSGAALEPVREKIMHMTHADENSWYWRNIRILKTWVIIFTGELFFRANGLAAGISMFVSMFDDFRLNVLWDGSLLTLGLDLADILIIIAGCITVAVIGSVKERKKSVSDVFTRMRLPMRWIIYYALILSLIIFGAYGAGYQKIDLIYAGF